MNIFYNVGVGMGLQNIAIWPDRLLKWSLLPASRFGGKSLVFKPPWLRCRFPERGVTFCRSNIGFLSNTTAHRREDGPWANTSWFGWGGGEGAEAEKLSLQSWGGRAALLTSRLRGAFSYSSPPRFYKATNLCWGPTGYQALGHR